MRATRTSDTFTLNSVSTAFLISGLVASRCTSKQIARWVSLTAVDFSVMSGRRITSYRFFIQDLRLGRSGSWTSRREALLEPAQGVLGDEERSAIEDVVDREVRRVDDLEAGDIASRKHEGIHRLVIDEHGPAG